MSWRVTLHCSRAEAEALPESEELFPSAETAPVIVADEPDPHAPDDWRIHAYFAHEPAPAELEALARLAAGSTAEIEQLGEDDWVTMSQAGLEPIRAAQEPGSTAAAAGASADSSRARRRPAASREPISPCRGANRYTTVNTAPWASTMVAPGAVSA